VLVREPIGWARDGIATERLSADKPAFTLDERVQTVPPSAIITPRPPWRVPWLAIAVVALSAIVIAVVFGWPSDPERDDRAPVAAPASETTPLVARDAGADAVTDSDSATDTVTDTLSDSDSDSDSDSVTDTESGMSPRDHRRRRPDRRREPPPEPARMGIRGIDAFERDLMR
jgi:hypothetical protein